MTETPAPRHHATPEQLDDLQLLRAGLYGPGATALPIPVRADVAAQVASTGRLVVEDGEGVPVAALDPADVDGLAVTGTVRWLVDGPSRPFQELQMTGPVDLSGRPVRVVRSEVDLEGSLPAGVHLLVIASTSLDGCMAGTELTRRAVAAASTTTGATVGVVPLPPGRREREEALLATLGLSPTGAATAPAGRPAPGGGVVVLLTGLSGSGKSTVARAVAVHLVERGRTVTLLDGDRVRRHLSSGLGFGAADRETNVRRIGWVAAEVAHHGGAAVCSAIAPSERIRREVAEDVARRGGRFLLVHVSTPLAECERRDRKGLYAAARRGEVPDFTGISAPYDVPAHPDLRLDTTGRPVEECAAEVLALLDPDGPAGDRA